MADKKLFTALLYLRVSGMLSERSAMDTTPTQESGGFIDHFSVIGADASPSTSTHHSALPAF